MKYVKTVTTHQNTFHHKLSENVMFQKLITNVLYVQFFHQRHTCAAQGILMDLVHVYTNDIVYKISQFISEWFYFL